ncbi:SAM-dependent methyltransferase [Streptomyces sp. CA2R106]|uniref:SAM-dependent methyltransferase n=1 Tax=Streptomyces sp. CA2R106 TaxID=3120153 RepID=UPI003009F69C
MNEPATEGGPATGDEAHVPSPARMYDYILGGKDNFETDRERVDAAERAYPGIKEAARINRMLLLRMARYFGEHTGVDQFIDVGTGIPTEPNYHQVVQAARPEARILCTDFSKTVLRYTENLAAQDPEGRISYVHADVREPEKILDAARAHLDLSRPVAMTMVALLHFISDEFDPHGIVKTLTDALAPGSYLAISQVTGDFDAEGGDGVVRVYRAGGTPAQVRSYDEVARFFDGFELVAPGLVVAPRWHPELAVPMPWPEPAGSDRTPVYAAIGRKR